MDKRKEENMRGKKSITELAEGAGICPVSLSVYRKKAAFIFDV